MESAVVSADSEEREEGEIVDDDFEDISDNSFKEPLWSGKSVPSKDSLRALSLSSISDGEASSKPKRRRKSSNSKKNPRKQRKRRLSHRKSVVVVSDSDECEGTDPKFKLQLKATVNVEKVVDEHHGNSLQKRLKVMNNVSDANLETTEKEDTGEGLDKELIELRAEALKTAVMNKFKNKKKRKYKVSETGNVLSDLSAYAAAETDKENNACDNFNNIEKAGNDVNDKKEVCEQNNISQEEDEDILRANLLASMSKKITTAPSNAIKNKKTINPSVKSRNTKKITQIKLPAVKPLIINLMNDSDDSNDELVVAEKSTPVVTKNNNTNKLDIMLDNKIDNLLKEQRAKVEAINISTPVNTKKPPTIKKVEANNTSKLVNTKKIPTALEPKSKVKKVEANNTSTPINTKKSPSAIEPKSSVKLLPESQQREYQTLLLELKLRNAQKKRRKVSVSSSSSNNNKVCKTPKSLSSTASKGFDLKKEVALLNSTLKDVQCETNGRLQIREKYKVLSPLIKKISEASAERKKHDNKMKQLLEELAETKKKLAQSNLLFKQQINQFVCEKVRIDKRPNASTIPVVNNSLHRPQEVIAQVNGTSVANTVQATNASALPNNIRCDVVDDNNTEDCTDNSISLGDPNDILKIIKKEKSQNANTVSNYISPLDTMRDGDSDPLAILCPFEVDGRCRDSECKYKHLS